MLLFSGVTVAKSFNDLLLSNIRLYLVYDILYFMTFYPVTEILLRHLFRNSIKFSSQSPKLRKPSAAPAA